MEKFTVVGIRNTEFTPKDSNRAISGMSLHCTYGDDHIDGYGVERIFVTFDKLDGYLPEVGDIITPIYNKYGKISQVIKA